MRALNLNAATVEYIRPGADTELLASARLVGDPPRPMVDLKGRFQGRPLSAKIEGASLEEGWPDSGYALVGEATSESLQLSVETELDSLLAPRQLEGRLRLSGESVHALTPWTGSDLPSTPAFSLEARVDRDAAVWRAERLRLDVGASSLRGDLQLDTTGQPKVQATLASDLLDLRWLVSDSASSNESQSRSDRADAEHDSARLPPELAWLRSFNADVELTATRIELPQALAFNELELQAVLQEGTLDVERLAARLAGGSLTVNGQLDATQVPISARLATRFEDISLGRLADSYTPLEERLGEVSGSVNILATGTLDKTLPSDILVPVLGRLKIEPSELRFSDAEADTDAKVRFRTRDLVSGDQYFTMEGSGRYHGAPFSLDLRGDALLDARLPSRPYSIDLDANVVNTRIELKGSLLRPLALEGLDLQFELAGPNPQQLSRLFGMPLPDLPAYTVSGQLGLMQHRWSLTNLSARVGDTDVSGRLVFDSTESPPLVRGDLSSDMLDIKDLAAVIGAESTENPEQAKNRGPQGDASGTGRDESFFPDGILLGDAWKQVKANIHYRSDSVRTAKVPLSNLAIDFRLADGMAHLDPLSFGVGDGEVDFSLELDVSQNPPEGTLAIEVRGVDLRDALEEWDLAEQSFGTVAGQGKFWVTGDSISALAASMDGGLVMVMTGGQFERVLVELAGLDAAETALSWLGGRDPIPVNCAYADLKARDGRVNLETFVIDTPDTIFTAGGHVDLGDEQLDVSIVAHPQDVSALVARTPFHLGGTLGDIEVGIHGGELALRAGASAALAALMGPLAAVLPLLETGGDNRLGYCQGLTERTRQAIKNEEVSL